jgi:hypothetical protein
MKNVLLSVGGVIAFFALFCFWYSIAANYDYSALAGNYTFHGDGESSTLLLGSDGTFRQELHRKNSTESASGTWHRVGESGASFSQEFLRISGAKMYREEFPDHLDKVLGLYPTLTLNAYPPGPTLHKQLLR